MQPLPGDRVVVRYRLGAGGPDDWRADSGPNPSFAHTPSLSDITGVLRRADGRSLWIERDGTEERVPVSAIVSLRQLSMRTVRNSEIRAVERRLTESARATETATIDGWTATYSPDSDAVRANAAVPLELGASAAALRAIGAWYAERGRAARIVVPERLLRSAEIPGSRREYEALTRAGELAEVPGDAADERRRLRANGFGLHHTFWVIDPVTA